MVASTLPNRFQDMRDRVNTGKSRESQIIAALIQQCDLDLKPATESQDKEQKIDCFCMVADKPVAMQIKFRETGDDLLVEVFDRFYGWDDKKNKIGRDMIGKAELYAVLRQDKRRILITQTVIIKNIVNAMLRNAQCHGWTKDHGEQNKTLDYHKHGGKCELKVQRDPRDGRTKMMAYIPVDVFTMEYKAQQYHVAMPKKW